MNLDQFPIPYDMPEDDDTPCMVCDLCGDPLALNSPFTMPLADGRISCEDCLLDVEAMRRYPQDDRTFP